MVAADQHLVSEDANWSALGRRPASLPRRWDIRRATLRLGVYAQRRSARTAEGPPNSCSADDPRRQLIDEIQHRDLLDWLGVLERKIHALTVARGQ